MKLITHNYAGLGFVFKAHQLLHTRSLWPLMQHGTRVNRSSVYEKATKNIQVFGHLPIMIVKIYFWNYG